MNSYEIALTALIRATGGAAAMICGNRNARKMPVWKQRIMESGSRGMEQQSLPGSTRPPAPSGRAQPVAVPKEKAAFS
jgi:hypothetical protein